MTKDTGSCRPHASSVTLAAPQEHANATASRIRWRLVVGIAATALISSPVLANAETAPQPSCTLIVDAKTGKKVHSTGDCARRHSPASTFKLPLAVMAFDAGILLDPINPVWEMPSTLPGQEAGMRMGTPSTWQSESLLWYSREITKTLGRLRLEQYVYKLDYGNKDVSTGVLGRPGTESAWVGGSLLVSAQEQVDFLRKLVRDELPVSVRAQQAAKSIIGFSETDAGWVVHGRTGSTWTYSRPWIPNQSEPTGWFVGWATRGDRLFVFARVTVAKSSYSTPLGTLVKKQFLHDFDALVSIQ